MSKLPLSDAEFNLQQVLQLMNGLSQWLIRSGVGYSEFCAALKPVFYQQALIELDRIEQKKTISAISLLSGLHRKDVTAFKEALEQGKSLSAAPVAEPLSVPARVVGVWLAEQWPQQLIYSADEQGYSFENLVRKISTERHPRSIFNELARLGIVEEQDDHIVLLRTSFIPDIEHQDSRKILSQNLQSHIQAGLYNLFSGMHDSRLEEAIRVDELSPESVQFLKTISIEKWEQLSQEIMQLAVDRCQQDSGKEEAKHAFCLGVYQCES